MNITIIGAGNMGSAIARGLVSASTSDTVYQVTIADPSTERLEELKKQHPALHISSNNREAVSQAEVVIIAVKPWIVAKVAEELSDSKMPRTVVSIAAGIGLDKLKSLFGDDKQYFYVIPNTAVMVKQGMTFITASTSDRHLISQVENIFKTMGEVSIIDEDHIPAATALSSCGIAYVFKYVQACVQAGTQLGFRPDEACRITVQTVIGAMNLLQQQGTTPQLEIDKVTTPGGMTIRGINKLEETGFTSAVIQSIIEPLKK